MENGAREAILHGALIAEGFKLSNHLSGELRYSGTIASDGRSVGIEIWFHDLSFTSLPKLKILAPAFYAHSVAHFEGDGYYCYTGRLSKIIDKYDIRGAIRSILVMISRALADHMRQEIFKDISEEFLQHWLPCSAIYADFCNTGDRVAQFRRRKSNSQESPLFVDHNRNISCYGELCEIGRREASITSPIISFEGELTFLNEQKQPSNLRELYDWLLSLSEPLAKRVIAAFSIDPKASKTLVIIEARNSVIGIKIEISDRLRNASRKHLTPQLVKAMGGAVPLERVGVKVGNTNTLIGRSLGESSSNLGGKRIALVGCGTIGSHLAKTLVQSGAGFESGQLVLVDDESLELENIGRHFLGQNALHKNKANACVEELKRMYPEASILGRNANALDLLDQFKNFDLIIDATGEDAVSIEINEWLISTQRYNDRLSGLFIWLFGNAHAAQGLLVEADNGACFKCLKPRHGEPWRYDPRRDPQDLEVSVGQCGDGTFIPYGVGGSIIAAGLANNMALDWASCASSPKLRTLRINTEETRSRKDTNPPAHNQCPACDRARPDD